jgi:putative membrane protein
MAWLINLVVFWIVTAIALYIISKIPFTGVEIANFKKAIIAAIVLGIVNALLGPILNFLGAPLNFLTFGLFSIIISAFIFGLSAWLVPGFALRKGILSAIIGAVLLGLINYGIYYVLSQFVPVTPISPV